MAAFGCALFAFAPRAAHAEPPSAPPSAPIAPSGQTAPSAQIALMDQELALFAEHAKSQRTVLKITGAISAAAMLPTGYALAQRSDPVSKQIGVGLEIGGIASLVVSLTAWIPSGVEMLQKGFEARRASGMDGAELVRLVESDWERTANAAHGRRKVIGIVDLSLGIAAMGAGMFFLLADPVGKMDRNDQNTLGYSLFAPGVPFVVNGFRMLLEKSVEEVSWEAYRATKALTERPSARSYFPTLGIAPLRGGGAAVATYTF